MKLFLLLAASSAFGLAQDDSFLVRNATVHTVSGSDIPNGSILVLKGRIAGVGARLAAPKGVRIIEGKGIHVYPGMIDSGANLGMQEITAVRETADIAELGDFNPQLRAAIAVNPSSQHIPVVRANGITAAVALPEGGLISGQASLMSLDGWTWEEMEISRSAALHLRFPVITMTTTSTSPEGARRISFEDARREYERRLRSLDDFFEQARRYERAKSSGGSPYKTDLKLEAMLPVLAGKLPLLVTAVRERAVRDALAFAEKQKIRIILAGLREPGKSLDQIKVKKIPVILGPTLALPLNEDDPYDAPFTLPAELHKAGIKFAFASFSNQFSRNLPYQAANAVTFGLPYEAALRAVTLNAAEIWGVADRIGSIEEGKWADLMFTDGDPLETRTQVKQLFIRGKEANLNNKHRELYEKYRQRP